MPTTLSCPKCASDMRSYERNEVHVDQCTGCGGLFLDRGELERLVTAESAYYGAPAGGHAAPPPPSQPQAPQHHSPQHHAPPQHFDPRYGKKKSKKRSFLEELFE